MNNAEIDWNKEFPVNSLCRADVQEAGFPDEQIALLTDEDMQAIADKMADWYDENGFWEDLTSITNALWRKRSTLMIDWEKSFPIAFINRADLSEFGLTYEQISEIFTDEVMIKVADQMQAAYFTGPAFWANFRRAVGSFVTLTDTDNRMTGGCHRTSTDE